MIRSYLTCLQKHFINMVPMCFRNDITFQFDLEAICPLVQGHLLQQFQKSKK